MTTNPNDYRYDIYEGPHRIGRRYRCKKDAVNFTSKNGSDWFTVTVYPGPSGDRLCGVADYLGRPLPNPQARMASLH
jgi:hypothetical protein